MLPALVAFALLLTSLGVASGSVANGRWFPTESTSRSGCGSLHGKAPVFNPINGLGRWRGLAHAVSCKAGAGGPTTLSTARALGSITLVLPIRLGVRDHGVEVVWNLSALLRTAGAFTGKPSSCPTKVTTSTMNFGYTWVNTTSRTQDCFAIGTIAWTGSTYLVNRTSGAILSSNATWAGLTNTSGVRIDDSSYAVSYSNRSYWSQNYSSSSSSNASWGAAAAFNVSFSPAWFVNGSFRLTDRYVLVTSLTGFVLASCQGFPQSAALASIQARGTGLFEQVSTPIVY